MSVDCNTVIMSQKYAAEESNIHIEQLLDLGDDALGLKMLVNCCEATYIGVCHCLYREERKMMLEQVTVAHSGTRLVGLVGLFFSDVKSLRVIGMNAQAQKRLWNENHGVDNRKSKSLMSQILPPPSINDEATDDESHQSIHSSIKDAASLLPNFTRTIFRPTNWIIVTDFGDDFQQCLRDLECANVIAVFACGMKLGRRGTLAWFCLGTVKCVYAIDAASIGVDTLLSSEIGAMLKDETKVKIIHNARRLDDYLFHKFQFHVENVFDTQASDIYLQALFNGNKPPLLVSSLSCLVHRYLNVPESSLTKVFQDIEDESMWLERPLSEPLILFLVHSVIFLAELREVMITMALTDLNRLNKMFVHSLRAKPALDVIHAEEKLVPPEIQKMFKQPLLSDTFKVSRDCKF